MQIVNQLLCPKADTIPSTLVSDGQSLWEPNELSLIFKLLWLTMGNLRIRLTLSSTVPVSRPNCLLQTKPIGTLNPAISEERRPWPRVNSMNTYVASGTTAPEDGSGRVEGSSASSHYSQLNSAANLGSAYHLGWSSPGSAYRLGWSSPVSWAAHPSDWCHPVTLVR